MSTGEVDAREVLRRVFMAGLDPFATFARIARRPDALGPLMCSMLLVFACVTENMVPLAKVQIYLARGESIPPRVEVEGSVVRVVAVNATSAVRKAGPVGEEQLALLYAYSLGVSVITWLCWAAGIWLALNVFGASPRPPSALLSGYALSAEFYRRVSRAVLLAWLLRDLSALEVVVPANSTKLSSLLNLVSLAVGSLSELRAPLMAHWVFFSIWSAVVVVAALAQGTTSMRRAIAGGAIALIVASLMQSLAQYLLLLIT